MSKEGWFRTLSYGYLMQIAKMSISQTSRDLEKLVHRVHSLIERDDAVVTWNQRIRDPDTHQLRQIDGMIEREGKRTHIECRNHKATQDVKWIEELIGRRHSLRADGIIAVSLSGFTKPAEAKALQSGIILRTFSEMTDAEVASWGKSAIVTLNYIKIKKFEIKAFINPEYILYITSTPKLHILGSNLSPEFQIVQELARQSEGNFFENRNTTLTANVVLPGMAVDFAPIVRCEVNFVGNLRQEQVEAIGVWNYHGVEPSAPTNATVSKHGGGSTEIIQSGDRVTMILDLAPIKMPRNCFLDTTQIDFRRDVSVKIEPVGLPKAISLSLDTMLDIKALV